MKELTKLKDLETQLQKAEQEHEYVITDAADGRLTDAEVEASLNNILALREKVATYRQIEERRSELKALDKAAADDARRAAQGRAVIAELNGLYDTAQTALSLVMQSPPHKLVSALEAFREAEQPLLAKVYGQGVHGERVESIAEKLPAWLAELTSKGGCPVLRHKALLYTNGHYLTHYPRTDWQDVSAIPSLALAALTKHAVLAVREKHGCGQFGDDKTKDMPCFRLLLPLERRCDKAAQAEKEAETERRAETQRLKNDPVHHLEGLRLAIERDTPTPAIINEATRSLYDRMNPDLRKRYVAATLALMRLRPDLSASLEADMTAHGFALADRNKALPMAEYGRVLGGQFPDLFAEQIEHEAEHPVTA